MVSFLIFVHLFALFAAVVFTRGASSELAQRMARIPVLRQYRQLLDMNLPYTYQLTYGAEPDYQIAVDLEMPDGATKSVLLPPADLWPHARQQRFEALAYSVGNNIGDEAGESVLPELIMTGLFDQYGATRGTFRCRAHNPLGRDRVLAAADPQGADTWENIYQATIWRTNDGPVRILKQESAAESAPGAATNGDAAAGSSPVPGTTLPTASNTPLPDATLPSTQPPR